MIIVTENYLKFWHKISDNLDFFIWVILFCIFLLVSGIGAGILFNWVLGGVLILFAFFYLFYLFVKLGRVKLKLSMTEFGIVGEKVFLGSKFKKKTQVGHADEFYLVYTDITGFKILKDNTLQIINKNKSSFDDLDYKFSNISDDNLFLVIDTFNKYGVKRLN